MRRRVSLALAYPFVLLLFMTGIVALMTVFIMDGFVRIFKDFGTELPMLTVLAIRGARPLLWFMASLVGLSVAVPMMLSLAPAAGWVWPALYRLPMVGPLLRWSHLAQFSRLMGLLLEQEVPIPSALRLAAAGVARRQSRPRMPLRRQRRGKGASARRVPVGKPAVPRQHDPDDSVGPADAGPARRLSRAGGNVRRAIALARHAAGNRAAADHVSGNLAFCWIFHYRHVSAVDRLDSKVVVDTRPNVVNAEWITMQFELVDIILAVAATAILTAVVVFVFACLRSARFRAVDLRRPQKVARCACLGAYSRGCVRTVFYDNRVLVSLDSLHFRFRVRRRMAEISRDEAIWAVVVADSFGGAIDAVGAGRGSLCT